jgi:hypothetical protein
MSSYFNNVPRQYTPSVFRSNKQTGCPLPTLPDEPVPDVNPCHKQYRQLAASHPYTWAKLREAESQRATRDAETAATLAETRAAEAAASARRQPTFGSDIFLK